MTKMHGVFVNLVCVVAMSVGVMYGAESGQFRVGAGKADITPPDNILPYEQNQGPGQSRAYAFVAVHERLYARAIVMDSGLNSAALVSLDYI